MILFHIYFYGKLANLVINMRETKIKVCGITTLEDALAIEALGVEYLGFNFIPISKRYISPEKAQTIIKSLTTAIPVGVFMDQNRNEVSNAIKTSGVTIAQLHGEESPQYCSEISIPVIKVFSIESNFDGALLQNYTPQYFLFDAKQGSERGGTGVTFDWSLIQSVAFGTPFFLAGGIGPHNILDANQSVLPFAFDINSKVEYSPGVKNIEQIKECLDLLNH